MDRTPCRLEGERPREPMVGCTVYEAKRLDRVSPSIWIGFRRLEGERPREPMVREKCCWAAMSGT